MSDTLPTSRTGRRFGPYQLGRLLGRGGMGEVYEAHDTVKDRTVALKLMSQELNSDDTFRRRMQREAHTAGRLQEPHIVPIHDFGEIDGQLYIDMRFIEGEDLSSLLERSGALPPARAVAIITQVAAALDAAHRAGVIHRDIKPENILITGDDFAYLVDFGIAAAATDQQLTKTGTAVGSWRYMAPERFADDETTYRSDIYGLACVLYECLTGAPPYQTQNLSALMAAHMMQPVPRPSHSRQDVPTAFDRVIDRGMAKNPADRFPTAGELARAAKEALSAPDRDRAATIIEHTQHHAPPPSGPVTQPHWTPPVSHPTYAAPPPQGPAHPPPQWRAAPPPRRNRWLLPAAALVVVLIVAGVGIWLMTGSRDAERTAPGTTTSATASSAAVTTASPTAAPLVTAAQLDSLLLSEQQIATIVGTTGIVVDHNVSEMKDPGPENTLSDERCLGALIGFQTRTYKSSGYTGMSAQLLQKPNSNPGYVVVQGSVVFASAQQAADFVTAQSESWQYCAGKSVTQVNSGKTSEWTFGPLSGNPPNIALSRTLADNPVACQHVLSAVSNVVFDVNVCAPGTVNQARLVANQMAAKLPK
ncbi:serine/threonine-protein kinase PknH/PknJ [Mycobacterium vicinigordonae]|uniref:non-specific serine/threonine protein kinase n=1 Tax=Mycobacterium vicinigordonae TaxID=1719132 RepID=A0A7D6IBP5_9MYCO|nr:serine/threonine-protein kinase PknH/PknJ [Mycobacterium vicinigordonae]QLL09737.1 sensor domain-containing protein [Mycobacterium vicinigordonae]